MNEKVAKGLRRKIRLHPDSQKVPKVNYISRTVGTRRHQLGLDKEGNKVYVDLPIIQIRLGTCQRAIYKRVKRALQ